MSCVWGVEGHDSSKGWAGFTRVATREKLHMINKSYPLDFHAGLRERIHHMFPANEWRIPHDDTRKPKAFR